MSNQVKKYDVLTAGRSSIDLYANEIGEPFTEIKNFGAFVGGSPTNIAVGCRRLGLNSALLTCVGNDRVGDFILNFLEKEGVETKFIPRKPGTRSSAVLLGIEPPDRFPLVYYRENAADIQISIDDVLAAPIENSKLFEVSGTALSKEPSRSAIFFAAEQANKNSVPVLLDLDFRSDQWHDLRAFGVTVRAILRMSNIAIGTEEEIKAAMLTEQNQVKVLHSQISGPEVQGDLNNGIEEILKLGVKVLIVKRGSKGATVHQAGKEVMEVPGFSVEVLNVLGAGDAFASGVIYGYLKNWDWYKAVRMGNAVGAIVVTRHGCANFMPFEQETFDFIEEKGGF